MRRINHYKINFSPAFFFGKIGIISIFIAFYLYLFLEAKYGIHNSRYFFLSLGYFTIILKILLSGKLFIEKKIFCYYSLSIILYLFSFPFWLIKLDINIYLSSITAILIISYFDYFVKFLKIFILITLLLAAYEFFIKEYLFVVMRETNFGFRALNEELFGGTWGIFRAKVFFEGPLALSQFVIGAAFLLRKNVRFLVVLFLISIFANGRLGMIISALILLLYFIEKYKIVSFLLKPRILLLVLLGLLILLFSLFNLLDKTSLTRLNEAFDISNKGNNARIDFWINGFKTWINYDIIHLIFGNNGYFESIYKNNAENGWITLLMNNGIIGFSFYFFPLLAILINSIKNLSFDFSYIVLLFFCMFIQTFHLGASANLFYWLIIFSFLSYTTNTKHNVI